MPRRKVDPLIAALIAKLPNGGEWETDKQIAWLSLMAMAFGTVYGGDAASRMGSASKPAPAAVAPPRRQPAHQFSIDRAGYARRADGARVMPSEIEGPIFDLRGVDGDVRSIRWADDSTGLNGADLTIVAA